MIDLLVLSTVFVASVGAAAAIQLSALRLLLRAMRPGAPAHEATSGEQP